MFVRWCFEVADSWKIAALGTVSSSGWRDDVPSECQIAEIPELKRRQAVLNMA